MRIRADLPEGLSLVHKKGGETDEWPVDLMVREFPKAYG